MLGSGGRLQVGVSDGPPRQEGQPKWGGVALPGPPFSTAPFFRLPVSAQCAWHTLSREHMFSLPYLFILENFKHMQSKNDVTNPSFDTDPLSTILGEHRKANATLMCTPSCALWSDFSNKPKSMEPFIPTLQIGN